MAPNRRKIIHRYSNAFSGVYLIWSNKPIWNAHAMLANTDRRTKKVMKNLILHYLLISPPYPLRLDFFWKGLFNMEFRINPFRRAKETTQVSPWRSLSGPCPGSGGRGGSYPTMLSCVQAAAEKETQKPCFWEKITIWNWYSCYWSF